jgi:hypothetical protein
VELTPMNLLYPVLATVALFQDFLMIAGSDCQSLTHREKRLRTAICAEEGSPVG